jgi:hypothetical protein
MRKAKIQVVRRMAAQELHPITVWSLMCFEFLNSRKKTNREVTDAYRHPRKRIVGIMKENETFLYRSSRDPKAGALTYWLPL